jgi:2-amino-4-hydroxy-6-hydroxymethyldihydropteridine diphosphokinase
MAARPVTVYLGLGSNLGNRAANLRMAQRLLAPLCRIEAVSSLYETEPVGGVGPPSSEAKGQPPYYNAACRAVTGLAPGALLRHLKNVEHELGRRPSDEGPRWAPRPIDLDILFFGDEVIEEEGLIVPHPRLAERAFVLVPLADLCPEYRHPTLGRTVLEMLAGVSRDGVRLVVPSASITDEGHPS